MPSARTPDRRRLLIVDGRRSDTAKAIEEAAGILGVDVVRVAETEEALRAKRECVLDAAFVHLNFRLDASGCRNIGATVACQLRDASPTVPILIFTGDPAGWKAPAVIAHRLSDLVVHDDGLAARALPITSSLVGVGHQRRALAPLLAPLTAKPAQPGLPEGFRLDQLLTSLEARLISSALASYGFVHHAATFLGTPQSTLRHRMDSLGIRTPPLLPPVPEPESTPMRTLLVGPSVRGGAMARALEAGGSELRFPEPGEDPLAATRRTRPSLVLVSLGDGPGAVTAWALEHHEPNLPVLLHGDRMTSPAEMVAARLGLTAPVLDRPTLEAALPSLVPTLDRLSAHSRELERQVVKIRASSPSDPATSPAALVLDEWLADLQRDLITRTLEGRSIRKAASARRVRSRMLPPMDEAGEAKNILELCGGDRLRAFEMVQAQLGVLVLRTQVMLSLSGIVITVTGFSGRAIAQTSLLARASVVGGLFLVLAAAAVAVGGVLRLRWITQELGVEPLQMLERGIAIRDRKSRYLRVALVLFVVGFGLYCLAVAQLLLAA